MDITVVNLWKQLNWYA